ncbi:hypothetical protein GGX14DRAFT_645763 [Mycena pura]|uniref:Protein kinase domain-containing protein n=1 Tax=Mycena pura TaxID=153505 RepID=A0AAD6YDW9_9AGAR|nr:hypothetical protein GGX14DRAFT_645763 [Mycena pura]
MKPGGSTARPSSDEESGEGQIMIWLDALQLNFRGEVPVQQFLDDYLPRPRTEKANTIRGIVVKAAVEVANAKRQVGRAIIEAKMYKPLVAYLKAMARGFPRRTRPEFYVTHGTQIPSIDPDDHDTAPDIIAARPGPWTTVDGAKQDDEEETVSNDEEEKWKGGWPDVGTALELELKTDIFTNDGQINDSDDSKKVLIQITKSARGLLACGRCFAFVVTVFGLKARILRFDRAGWQASTAFDWSLENDILPMFFWRLYNPDVKDNRRVCMYGDDDTITIPTLEEKHRMYNLWKGTSSYKKAPLSFEEATRDSRWMEASRRMDAEQGEKRVLFFTIGPPLYQSDGLFSRATRVDRVLIKGDPTPTVYALKDTWRQLSGCRRPEIDFYDTIKRYCEENNISMEGMAQCLGSVELEHKTIFASLDAQQRCHTRSLLTPVGMPLKFFTSTKQLVQVLQAAAKQHQIAYAAGVIHRDVSEGNVSFDTETMKGLLFDWDYAEFTPEGKNNFEKWYPKRANDSKNQPYPDLKKSLKDFTGTFAFVAIEILEKNVTHEPKHDLESFFYLLVWMILRHTFSDQANYPKMCVELFDNPAAAAVKRDWLSRETELSRNNLPIFELVDILRESFKGQNPPRSTIVQSRRFTASASIPATPAKAVTYEDFLRIFEEALNFDDWPDDDPAIPFVPYTPREGKSLAKSHGLARSALEIFARMQQGLRGVGAVVTRSAGKRRQEDDSAHATASTSNLPGLTSDDSGDEASEPAPKKRRRKPAASRGEGAVVTGMRMGFLSLAPTSFVIPVASYCVLTVLIEYIHRGVQAQAPNRIQELALPSSQEYADQIVLRLFGIAGLYSNIGAAAIPSGRGAAGVDAVGTVQGVAGAESGQGVMGVDTEGSATGSIGGPATENASTMPPPPYLPSAQSDKMHALSDFSLV